MTDNEDRRLMLEGLAERAGKVIADQHREGGGDGKYLGLACEAFAKAVWEHAISAMMAHRTKP